MFANVIQDLERPVSSLLEETNGKVVGDQMGYPWEVLVGSRHLPSLSWPT